MYDIITDIINHTWQTQGANEQQYIYMICGSLMILFFVVAIDMIYRIFSNFWRN